jgi:hypothetical protein
VWPEAAVQIHDKGLLVNYLPIPYKTLAYSTVNSVLFRYVNFKLGLNILEGKEPIMFHYILIF